ncbi:optineurin-like [Mya arenaria]|uniref:optineurin-like n=1 Tax=Mya arenaria TaxID=6604 RepID=UPI0022E612D0|nr:optineurin-like [Mya arenaria]
MSQSSANTGLPQPNISVPPTQLLGGPQSGNPPFNGYAELPSQHGNMNQSHPSRSSGSSFSVLSNHTGMTHSNVFVQALPNGNGLSPSMSLTDISLEQAMEKVHELAHENATLRDYVKENNENMKKQFSMLLQWKGKVRESNQQNLQRFEALQRQILQLGAENEKYKQCLQGPEKQNSVMEELHRHVRNLEEDKASTEHKIAALREKIEELTNQLDKAGTEETVLVNTAVDEGEIETYKKRCNELSHQVYNFHEQNEQLMADLQQVNAHKVQIQMENNRLYEDNLALQKKMQSFLGDMNKTKFSLGALQDPSNTQYQYGKDSGEKESPEKEQTGSVPEKSDMEILALQAAAMGDRVLSAENAAEQTEMLRSQLQEEKSKTTKQSQTLTSRELEINRLQGKLGEQEQLIGHYKEQLDSQIANLTLEHQRQQDNLVQQLDHFKSQQHGGDVQSLKAQVMSLIQEIQETSAKFDMASKTIDVKSNRIMELEEHIRCREEQNAQSQRDMNNYVHTLKSSLQVSEETINKERMEHATTKKQLMEFRASFNQLVSDYKDLLDTFDEYKASVTQQQEQSGPKTRQQLEEINRLTAQTIAAEEAITFRDDQIKELKSEIARLKDDVDNTIPVLRAQLEVYQQDFEAERNARERQVEEKENIIAEMKNLEVKNQQLLDEVESNSRRTLADMQRRHASPSYHQQLQNQLQGGSNVQHRAPSPGSNHQQQPIRSGHQLQGGYQGQQVDRSHGDDLQQNTNFVPVNPPQFPGRPGSAGSGGGQDEEGNQTCPKCGVYCPDMDTLQIHVLDCIDN